MTRSYLQMQWKQIDECWFEELDPQEALGMPNQSSADNPAESVVSAVAIPGSVTTR
ncbi:hypothetical protein [Halomonas litopenaei]|uniref:hypothetical protein n=1 Tax=Halomonas litopenaei TaxID=2109328 RepID=UPI003FA09770